MHQRGASSRARESVSPEEAHAYYADDKSDDKRDASDRASMHHLLSMIFLASMLICTIVFLRYDNSQIGIAARAVGDLEKIIKDQETGREVKDKRIVALQREISDCKNSPDQDLSKLKVKIAELEKQLKAAGDEVKKVNEQKDALATQAVDLKAILEFKLQQLQAEHKTHR